MKKDPKKALSIYHKTVELYPNSAYAFSSLAKAYADKIINLEENQVMLSPRAHGLILHHRLETTQYAQRHQAEPHTADWAGYLLEKKQLHDLSKYGLP